MEQLLAPLQLVSKVEVGRSLAYVSAIGIASSMNCT